MHLTRHHKTIAVIQRVLACCLSLSSAFIAACSGGSDGGPACINAPPQVSNCTTAVCSAIAISGDAPHANPGTFRGFADPALTADPAIGGRVWLAYSWPHVVAGQDPAGNTVQLAAVENRLARSDDNGATFQFVGTLWSDVAAADPEGSGENGRISSETASLAVITNSSGTTWYGAHLRYFLRPQTGYNPKYATSWHVRIGAAASPAALATAPETVLGVSTTAAAYQPAARLDQLAGLPDPALRDAQQPEPFHAERHTVPRRRMPGLRRHHAGFREHQHARIRHGAERCSGQLDLAPCRLAGGPSARGSVGRRHHPATRGLAGGGRHTPSPCSPAHIPTPPCKLARWATVALPLSSGQLIRLCWRATAPARFWFAPRFAAPAWARVAHDPASQLESS